MRFSSPIPYCIFLILAFILLGSGLSAQVKEIKLKVDGLTCSMCCRTVESALRKLDFVADVSPNLQETSFDVKIRPGKTPNLNDVAKKVKDAGYSLSSCTFKMDFSKAKNLSPTCYEYDDIVFAVVNNNSSKVEGEHTIKVLGKDFLRNKEWLSFQKNIGSVSICSDVSANAYFISL